MLSCRLASSLSPARPSPLTLPLRAASGLVAARARRPPPPPCALGSLLCAVSFVCSLHRPTVRHRRARRVAPDRDHPVAAALPTPRSAFIAVRITRRFTPPRSTSCWRRVQHPAEQGDRVGHPARRPRLPRGERPEVSRRYVVGASSRALRQPISWVPSTRPPAATSVIAVVARADLGRLFSIRGSAAPSGSLADRYCRAPDRELGVPSAGRGDQAFSGPAPSRSRARTVRRAIAARLV